MKKFILSFKFEDLNFYISRKIDNSSTGKNA